jgi:tRNA(Arg) A34 adenosine deaminase TadA
MHPEKHFMEEAIALAQKGKAAGEAPIGAVVVLDGKIIAGAHTSLQT